MPTITARDIPPDLYQRLERSARVHRRSINSEIIFQIERALFPRRIEPDEAIARVRRLRAKTADYGIDDDECARRHHEPIWKFT